MESMGSMRHRVEGGNLLVLEREFSAPREKVFEMFADNEHLKQWWGPRGWELPYSNLDFRPGGTWHYGMKGMDQTKPETYGMESWGKAIFREIDRPNRIVYTDFFSDEQGNESTQLPPSTTTIDFVDMGNGGTRLVNRTEYPTDKDLQEILEMGLLGGIAETWDRLEEYLGQQDR